MTQDQVVRDDIAASISALVDHFGSVEVSMGDLPVGSPAVLVGDGADVGVMLRRGARCSEWACGLAAIAGATVFVLR